MPANEPPESPKPRRLKRPLLVLGGGAFLASLLAFVGWGSSLLDLPAQGGGVGIVLLLGGLLGAIVASAALLGAIAGGNIISRTRASSEGREGGAPEAGSQSAPPRQADPADPAAPGAARHAEMMHLLREIAENSLLTDPQKHEKLKRRIDKARRDCADQVERLLRQGEFHVARKACGELAERFGPDADVDALIERIEQVRADAETKDVAAARRKITDLMSISAWDRAEHEADDLLRKHPDCEQAINLARLVATERGTFERQQRQRLYADIQRHIARKEWRQALTAGREILDRYVDSTEAEAVRLKWETLQANAEIQERQDLEAEIKALIKKHHFAEAADLARKVIDAYPDSPQADVLRGQLTRLEEKAGKSR
ncbi:MAG: hypothetical protein JXQ73_18295 [Phycisphaerae bacterium]|nr:hypothetical protein [Phycisphaerae bacterium]